MTRKNLVDLIYHNSDMWSCPKKKCNDYSSKKCRKCAEELLAKYERKFYNKGYRDGEKNVAEKIKAEIKQKSYGIANDDVIQGMKYERRDILEIIDKYITKEGDNINEDKQAGQLQPTGTD